MAVRRFRDHITEHNWFAVGIDVLVVPLGVFLGLQANNWNEHRLDRQRGEQFRQRLIDDLDANEQDFRQRAIYYRQVHDLGYAALQEMRRSDSRDPVAFLNAAFKASFILPRSTRRATYQEIVSAGAMGSLEDESTRQKIMIYYSSLDMTDVLTAPLPPYREKLRGIVPYELQRAILVDCPELNLRDRRGRPDVSLNATCRPKLDRKAAASAASQIRTAPGMKFELTRSIMDNRSKISQFETMRAEAKELRAVLEAAVRN
jgi:hypothetical protein